MTGLGWRPGSPALTAGMPAPRCSMEVIGVGGRAFPVDFVILPITVQVWRQGDMPDCLAVVDRSALRLWLADPDLRLPAGEVTFLVDETRKPAVELPGGGVWVLKPSVFEFLHINA